MLRANYTTHRRACNWVRANWQLQPSDGMYFTGSHASSNSHSELLQLVDCVGCFAHLINGSSRDAKHNNSKDCLRMHHRWSLVVRG